jgi:5-methylthioadenosine/S-adenosylhomocysteine deaminase
VRVSIQGVLILDLDAPGAARGPVDIEIADGRISAIVPSELPERPERPERPDSGERLETGTAAARVIDGAGLLAIPGLVNAHLHSSGHFSRGFLDNLPLELFMLWELPPLEAEPSPPELYRLRVLLGAAEMLRSGITSVMDDPIYVPAATDEAIDAVMGAYRDVGLRATVSIYQPNRAEYDWFPYLAQLLPPDLRRRMSEQPRPPTAQIMRTHEAFFERWHGAAGGRLRCAASCSAPQRATDDYLTGLHALAADRGLPLVMHVYESKVQRVAGELHYGGSLVRRVRDLGALDERTVAVHAVWVDAQDISDLAEASCTVVHSPSGNLRCGSGIMPYRDLVRAGVPVALCTDEATVEDTSSLWSVGRLAAQLHKITGPDYEAWPTAEEILRAMTEGGARAMGLSGETGVLREGARADIVLVDLSTSTYVPMVSLPRHLVYGEDGRSVRMVIVDGQIVVEDGQVRTVDEQSLLEEARELASSWAASAGAAEQWAERLRPYVAEMYRRCARFDVGFTRWLGDPSRGARPGMESREERS